MKLYEVEFRVVDLIDGSVVLAATYQHFAPLKRMAVNHVRLFVADYHPAYALAVEPEIQIDGVRRAMCEYDEDEMLVVIGGGVGNGAYPAGPVTPWSTMYPHGTYVLVRGPTRPYVFWVDHWHDDRDVVGYKWSASRGWAARTINSRDILFDEVTAPLYCTERELQAIEKAKQYPPY